MPLFDPLGLLVAAPGLLLALVLHEYAHARVADRLGDPTPRAAGRLTLEPLAHLDPVGTLLLVVFGFGWAKPVPVNPWYFRNPLAGMALVAAAGPVTNLVLAFLTFVVWDLWQPAGLVGLAVQHVAVINVYLAVFNLMPIPPLDGSRVLRAFLGRSGGWLDALEPYGGLLVMLLLITNVLDVVLFPAAAAVLEGLSGAAAAVTGGR
ncbi:peptidase M50 [Thermaerobacter marianensis DSM 12885]|uniref:Peptidase M50 n=1 Tax=Thermaerobacter marianensis (strain ATCC 700841 / DSM 12885 / JCM 10246 / 7p75a) TaxID=644966 RepID=E6SKN9_THEM7|nr:site-2 protease family protein [Thermaerobacter marianensis]ADU51247.1 peptidase M50 [Thermaerobacter marianensis DSM 12885]